MHNCEVSVSIDGYTFFSSISFLASSLFFMSIFSILSVRCCFSFLSSSNYFVPPCTTLIQETKNSSHQEKIYSSSHLVVTTADTSS